MRRSGTAPRPAPPFRRPRPGRPRFSALTDHRLGHADPTGEGVRPVQFQRYGQPEWPLGRDLENEIECALQGAACPPQVAGRQRERSEYRSLNSERRNAEWESYTDPVSVTLYPTAAAGRPTPTTYAGNLNPCPASSFQPPSCFCQTWRAPGLSPKRSTSGIPGSSARAGARPDFHAVTIGTHTISRFLNECVRPDLSTALK